MQPCLYIDKFDDWLDNIQADNETKEDKLMKRKEGAKIKLRQLHKEIEEQMKILVSCENYKVISKENYEDYVKKQIRLAKNKNWDYKILGK